MGKEALSKGERTAQRILDEAECLFAQRGYGATSLREIAAAACLREPGIYNYFPSKQALYCAVLDRALQPLSVELDRLLRQGGNSEALRTLPGRMAHLLAAHPHIAALFQQALMSRGDPPLTPMEDWLERLVDKGRALFAQIAGQRFNDSDIALRVIMMFNITTGYFTAGPLLQHLVQKDVQLLLPQQELLVNRVMELLLSPSSKPAQ